MSLTATPTARATSDAVPAPVPAPAPASPPASAAGAANAVFEPVTVTARGAPIAMRFYASCGAARGAVLIVPAMGVPQRFYAPFASWLAGAGFHALTFDYSGTGDSLVGRRRDADADIFAWAERDTAAALRALEARAPGLPVTWIGHSLGGQIVPFTPGHERVAKVITVGTGSGYWRQNAPQLRRRVWIFWWGAVPLLTPLFGFFPGRALGMVGDLPRGVIRQWRSWCLHPEYCVGVEGPEVREQFAAVRVPLASLSFTDDEMMSAAGIAALHAFYTGAPLSMRRIDPRDHGMRRIGHFGCFRADLGAQLWPQLFGPELASRA